MLFQERRRITVTEIYPAEGNEAGKMTPCAVLVIQNGTTKLVNVKNQDGLTKILDMVPDFVDRFTSGKGDEESVGESEK